MPGKRAEDELSGRPRRALTQREVPLGPMTTLGIGGPCRALVHAASAEDVQSALQQARRESLPVLYLGAGSNVLFDDDGFSGLVIRNEMRGVEVQGTEVEVAGGHDLGELIRLLNSRGLAGMERMYGIPGTVAGAVVGNAGAYGQEISERLLQAEILENGQRRRLDARQLGFAYRHSRFKENPGWFLLTCRLRLERGQDDLQRISDDILSQRTQKYPPHLRCPGSFFKNLPLRDIPAESVRRMPESYVHYGKVPAGVLLEAVGAKGARLGDAAIAGYHGNLFFNAGGATSRDMRGLARHWAARVEERFGLQLEEEIRIVGKDGPANVPCPP
ncbi:MAG TPA: UDP-N-acetylmuramate dehydrogenase [Acidobacteriota bacterium]|nr:UDP-N-acetylmuramate dehydrogenase [Acidobacteriota bacterium]